MRDVGDRSCAVEVSSHASALHRLVGVRFSALAFTNLTQDHLDFHQSMEAYYEAKRAPFLELYENDQRPAAAINVDDAYGKRLAEELRAAGAEPLSFAMDEDADLRPDVVAVEPGGTHLAVGPLAVASALRGRFNAENLLAAIALGRLLGVPDEAIKRGLEHVRGVPGRFEAIPNDENFTVIVDYAHTPDALATVLSLGAGDMRRLADLRVRLRWRARSVEARADGRGGERACGSGSRHLRQPAERAAPSDH